MAQRVLGPNGCIRWRTGRFSTGASIAQVCGWSVDVMNGRAQGDLEFSHRR